jgi:hypothetical protein
VLEQELLHRLVRGVAWRILGEPSPTPSRVHQVLAAAVMVVGGGVFVYLMPHHFDQPPKVPWTVLVSLLAVCGVTSVTLAMAGQYRIGILRAAAALAAIALSVGVLMTVVVLIGMGVAYACGWRV